MTLDDLRARFPQFGFAIFAMDPSEDVTLEVYEPGGQTFQWRGPSVEAVLLAAFPAPSGVPPVADPAGVAAAEPETALTPTQGRLAGGTPDGGVFD